jgi:hypothetical protein
VAGIVLVTNELSVNIAALQATRTMAHRAALLCISGTADLLINAAERRGKLEAA